MISDLSLEKLLTAAAQILLPMLAGQLIYRLADRKGILARKLLPTTVKQALMLTAGVLLTVVIVGALAFVLGAGIEVYFIISGAAVGIITGIVTASMRGGEDK